MKLKQGLTLRKVGRKYMIVDHSVDGSNQSNVYTLNATAGYLWEKIGNLTFNHDMLTAWICEKYDVEPEQCRDDIDMLVNEWKKLGLIENGKD